MDLGGGGRGENFSGCGHVACQIKAKGGMQQHGSKYFAYRHTLTPGVGSKDQFISFSESSHYPSFWI